MNSMNQRLKQKLLDGTLIYGTVLTSGSPLVTEMLAQCGFVYNGASAMIRDFNQAFRGECDDA